MFNNGTIEPCFLFFKVFSSDYANGITAIAAIGTVLLAFITLLYLKREYKSKYRPYIIPEIKTIPFKDKPGFNVFILPRNIGPHPSYVRLSSIALNIGDETYETPSMKERMLLGRPEYELIYPVGHVNEEGVKKIREGRHQVNRIELCFVMQSYSIDDTYKEAKLFSFEINVLGERPQAQFRAEWSKDVKID